MEAQPLFKAIRLPNIAVTLKGTILTTLGDTKLLVRRSEDGGKTLGKEIIVTELAFQGGGLTVDETVGDILAIAEDRHPSAPLSVSRSQDGGKMWPLKRLVWNDPFQYSSLSAGRPSTASEGWVYMHFEG